MLSLSHGGNRGSNPLGDATLLHSEKPGCISVLREWSIRLANTRHSDENARGRFDEPLASPRSVGDGSPRQRVEVAMRAARRGSGNVVGACGRDQAPLLLSET